MGLRTAKLKKVTITLPEELLTYADGRAEREGTNRSQVIGQALASLALSEEQQLAAEGYQFYSDEAEEFATIANYAAAEALAPVGEWSGGA